MSPDSSSSDPPKSTEINKTNSSVSPTPKNNSNNYAAPNTPIASAKRPRNPSRSSYSGRLSTNNTPPPSTPNDTSQISSTPSQFRSIPEGSLSPMHPARPMQSHHPDTEQGNSEDVGAEEDSCTASSWGALFSPVLSFLGQTEENPSQDQIDQNDSQTKEETQIDSNDIVYEKDGDVAMVNNAKNGDDTHLTSAVQEQVTQPSPPSKQQERSSTPSQASPTGTRNVEESSTSEDEDLHDYDDESTEIEEEFNPYLFIKRLPIYSTVAPTPDQLQFHLPPKDENDPRQTLVLDLDETLVHCTVEPNTPNVDMVFPVVFHGMEYQVHVKKRPYLKEFLERVYKEFEVVVFTASQRVYADELLDRIDPEKKYIKHRMFRESCLPVEGNYLKDLNVLGRDLSAAVLVDNSPHAFGYQVDNGIPIESWFDDPHDTELLKLEQFLRTLKGARDVRPLVRAKFQTHRLISEA